MFSSKFRVKFHNHNIIPPQKILQYTVSPTCPYKEYYHTSLDIHIFFTGINIIDYRVPLELVGLMATPYEPHTRLSEVANPRPDFKSGINIVSYILLI